MRDYSRFDQYLDNLRTDVYPQPADPGHTLWAQHALNKFNRWADFPYSSVLDIGCGEGFMAPILERLGKRWAGVTLGPDYVVCKQRGLEEVYHEDMSFLPLGDDSFDVVFARHVLEHSPFPIITLMEWRRVARKALCLVAPAPEFWKWGGLNHYAVANVAQLDAWLTRAGWVIGKAQTEMTMEDPYLPVLSGNLTDGNLPENAPIEYFFFCRKS